MTQSGHHQPRNPFQYCGGSRYDRQLEGAAARWFLRPDTRRAVTFISLIKSRGPVDLVFIHGWNALLNGKAADLVFTDPPYNVRINGHVSRNGRMPPTTEAPPRLCSRRGRISECPWHPRLRALPLQTSDPVREPRPSHCFNCQRTTVAKRAHDRAGNHC
jgi:hypothetical protein